MSEETPNIKLPKFPEFKTTKNGYELRTEILGLAAGLVQAEYTAKYMGWEVRQHRTEAGQIITQVEMPEFPGLDKVLDAAEKMYAFVNQNTGRK